MGLPRRKQIRAALIFSWFYLSAAVAGLFTLRLLGLGQPLEARWRRRQRYVTGFFIRVLDAMRAAGIIDFDTRKAPARQEGPARVIIANHPSTVDVVAVLSIYREACVLVKQSNWDHPLLRPLFRRCGHIRTSDGSLEDTSRMMNEVRARLEAGFDVVVFPEGSRSPPGGIGVLHKGAFAVALHSGCNLLPLVIECDPPVLHRHAPWHALPSRPSRVRVRPLAEITPGDTTTRKLQRRVTELYHRELGIEVGTDPYQPGPPSAPAPEALEPG